ncbi:MAG TPA: protein kinase [Planctomycetota bacterium]|nr:protein kinase [Planctomycetota bacterium]
MSDGLSDRAARRLLAMAAEQGTGTGSDGAPPLPERYELLREIGRGGMGVVYEVFDRQLGRRCALKCIGAGRGASDEVRKRFVREALAAARLRHPHIAAVYDATPDYITMQLIAGGPIDAVHRDERHLLVELARDAARALQHAHEQGIVHRDIKPSNLLVEGRHVFVVDFGLAKEIAADSSQSIAGDVLGTPAFMPPEQALGRNAAIDARSDVYSLGATLYHCLAGAPPFAADDLPTLLRRVVDDDAKAPGLDRDLDLVLLECLAKEPEQRYQTAEALALDLDRWLRQEPVLARRPSFAYRLRKLVQRRRALVRAGLFAALVAGLATAMVLVPIALRESAARAAADEAVELADHAATVLQDATTFLRLGDHPSAQQALDAGIAEARTFLDRHDVPRVRYLLSRLLRARGRTDEALLELQRALAGDASLEEARFERGLMFAAQATLSDAERRIAIADLAPPTSRSVLTNIDVLFGKAERLRLEGHFDEATEVLREVLEYDATHVAARVSLSRAALALGEPDLARHYAASAVDLQQGYGPVYLAQERRQLPTTILGLDGPLVDFAPQLTFGPDNALALAHRGLVCLRRGLRLESEGNRAEALASVLSAVDDHSTALELHPELAGAWNNRAVCLMQADRLHAALGDTAAGTAARAAAAGDLRRALAASPELPEAHCNVAVLALREASLLRALGRAAAASQRAQDAILELEQALTHAPPGWPHVRACRDKLVEAEALRAGG